MSLTLTLCFQCSWDMIGRTNTKKGELSLFSVSTTVILPTGNKKSVIQLNHRGEEASTRIKPLFPYTWNGEW